jgi:diguanylate cyclase
MIRAADGKKAQDPFERMLSRLQLEEGKHKKALKQWHKLMADPGGSSDQSIDELVVLLGGTICHPADKDDRKKTGLLSRLFSQDAAENTQPNAMLRELLQQLKWPGPVNEQVSELISQLDQGASTDMWIKVITRVNEIVGDALSSFQSEVKSAQEFLSELSSRLQELDGFVQGSDALREASLQSGRELGRAMTEQVNGLSTTMQSSHDLEQLKSAVAERLDVIQSKVSSHLHEDEQRHQQAKQREQQLRDQLSNLEAEADALKKQMLQASVKAVRDAVTGLPNRQAYEDRIEQEYSRWKRFGEPLVMMVWDIDDFKKINDQFGHRSGDKALKVMAGKLKDTLRETDFIGRYGGEEFVVLLVGTDIEGAKLAAEKMRQRVEQTALRANDQDIRVTISGGLSLFQHGDAPADVFERADQALYKAKREGKNRWIVA